MSHPAFALHGPLHQGPPRHVGGRRREAQGRPVKPAGRSQRIPLPTLSHRHRHDFAGSPSPPCGARRISDTCRIMWLGSHIEGSLSRGDPMIGIIQRGASGAVSVGLFRRSRCPRRAVRRSSRRLPPSWSMISESSLALPSWSMLGMESVQQTLGLSEAQQQQQAEITTGLTRKIQAARREANDRVGFQKRRDDVLKEAQAALLATLKPEQRERSTRSSSRPRGRSPSPGRETRPMVLRRPAPGRAAQADRRPGRGSGRSSRRGDRRSRRRPASRSPWTPRRASDARSRSASWSRARNSRRPSRRPARRAASAWAAVIRRIEQVLTERSAGVPRAARRAVRPVEAPGCGGTQSELEVIAWWPGVPGCRRGRAASRADPDFDTKVARPA